VDSPDSQADNLDGLTPIFFAASLVGKLRLSRAQRSIAGLTNAFICLAIQVTQAFIVGKN
jgi:hypothetical protein